MGKSRMVISAERRVKAAERERRALELRQLRVPFRQIAIELGVADASYAYRIYIRALKKHVPKVLLEAEVTQLLDDLDRQVLEIRQLMARKHYVVSTSGKLITSPDGEYLDDDGFKLQAQALLLKVNESRRRLVGADAPTRTRIEVISRDAIMESMEQMNQELEEIERQAIDAVSEPAALNAG